MDPAQFDAFTRTLVTSRRSAVKLLLGGLVGLGAGFVPKPWRGGPMAARLAVAVVCQPTNDVSIPCPELNDYISQCGVICPSGGRAPGKGGCTEWKKIRFVGGDLSRAKTGERTKVSCGCQSRKTPFCTKGPVKATWKASSQPQSTVINFSHAGTPCCPDACRDEIAEVLGELRRHEDGHVANFTQAVADANRSWRNRRFMACGRTAAKAKRAFRAAVQQAVNQTEARIQKKLEEEPPQPRLIQCDKCKPGTTCCNNTCCADGKQCCGGQCIDQCGPCQVCSGGTCIPDPAAFPCAGSGTRCWSKLNCGGGGGCWCRNVAPPGCGTVCTSLSNCRVCSSDDDCPNNGACVMDGCCPQTNMTGCARRCGG